MEKTNVIIAENSLHPELRNLLLEKQEGYLNTDILSMQNYLLRISRASNEESELLLKVYHTVLEHRDSLTALKESAQYPFFAMELVSFLKEMASFSIAYESLPESTQIQKELKYLISLLLDLPLAEKKYTAYLNELKDASNVSFVNSPVFSALEDKRRSILLSCGAKPIEAEEVKVEDVHFLIAQNKRQEVEALAQYILSHEDPLEDYRIICGDEEYLSSIQRIFERYHIPLNTSMIRKTPAILVRFVALCEYQRNKNRDTLKSLLLSGAFPDCYHMSRLRQLAHYSSLSEMRSLNVVTEEKDLKDLYQKAMEEFDAHMDAIAEVEKDGKSLQEIIRTAFEITVNTIANDSEKEICLLIKNTIENYVSLYANLDELFLLLSGISYVYEGSSGGVRFTKMENSYTLAPKITVVLGSANLPDFRFFNGIFDEDYYSLLDYPSKEERYNLIEKATRKMLLHSKRLLVSFPIADYSGKTVNLNAFWEELMNEYGVKKELWPFIEGGALPSYKHKISSAKAEEIFLKDGAVPGSISSFEKYFNCPYSYFLSYGLKLKKKEYEIGPAQIGTILHSIMEQLINTYGKDYYRQEKDTYIKYIEEAFAPLYASYPTLHPMIDNLKARLTSHFFSSLDALSRIEEVSTYEPLKAEKKFLTELPLDPPIRLNGIVDRIDISEKGYRVIDYKSGNKALSLPKIRAGLQLQLLTYLMILEDTMARAPHGTYYFSFTDESIDVIAGSFAKRTNSTSFMDELDWREDYQNNHKLVGVSLTELPDDLKEYVKSLKQNDYQEFKAVLLQLYSYLGEQLLQGKIAPLPVETACQYCDFKGICHYYEDPLKAKDADIIARIEEAHGVQ